MSRRLERTGRARTGRARTGRPGAPRRSPLDRVARACVGAAARRWPAELSADMFREWCAELDALRDDPALGPFTRAGRTVAFAGSIALSPPVEAAGADPVTWLGRAAGAGRALTALSGAGAVTLLAAALVNVTHLAYHRVGPRMPAVGDALVDAGLLAAAAVVMTWIAVVAARRHPLPADRPAASAVRRTAAFGLATYAFLLAGNRVAVMPFMGWIDIAPAVVTWAVLTGAAAAVAARCSAAGRPRLGLAAGAAGALVALEAATVAGSLHAASALGLSFTSAPAWFPLTLLPGGIADFGPAVAAAGPSVAAAGPGAAAAGLDMAALRASEILLGNASAMVGPLLLCSTFLITYVVRASSHHPARAAYGPRSAGAAGRASAVPALPDRRKTDRAETEHALSAHQRRMLKAAGAALASLAACVALSRSGVEVGATLAGLRDNATLFGFGFAAHVPGRTAVAVVVGVAAFRYAATTAEPSDPM